jgi:hypothetical protein
MPTLSVGGLNFYACKGVHALFTGQREREKNKERERERIKRERKRKRKRKR